MSNNKQTSVDKLWDDVKGWIPQGQYSGVREYYIEAKAMHKEEIIDFAHINSVSYKHEITQKYNETYGGNK